MSTPHDRQPKAVYIAKWCGWFWVVPHGQKAIYYGAYRTEKDAQTKGPIRHQQEYGDGQ